MSDWAEWKTWADVEQGSKEVALMALIQRAEDARQAQIGALSVGFDGLANRIGANGMACILAAQALGMSVSASAVPVGESTDDGGKQ